MHFRVCRRQLRNGEYIDVTEPSFHVELPVPFDMNTLQTCLSTFIISYDNRVNVNEKISIEDKKLATHPPHDHVVLVSDDPAHVINSPRLILTHHINQHHYHHHVVQCYPPLSIGIFRW
jgi:hypothetical protein